MRAAKDHPRCGRARQRALSWRGWCIFYLDLGKNLGSIQLWHLRKERSLRQAYLDKKAAAHRPTGQIHGIREKNKRRKKKLPKSWRITTKTELNPLRYSRFYPCFPPLGFFEGGVVREMARQAIPGSRKRIHWARRHRKAPQNGKTAKQGRKQSSLCKF